jgi:Tripartite tricarboxylate transporter family receptor
MIAGGGLGASPPYRNTDAPRRAALVRKPARREWAPKSDAYLLVVAELAPISDAGAGNRGIRDGNPGERNMVGDARGRAASLKLDFSRRLDPSPPLEAQKERRSGFAAAIVIAAVALSGSVAPAMAQDYPNRPITLVVPFAPGGSTTIVARLIGDRLAEALKQQMIIDNRPGAGGTLGTRQVAKSAPDGYTIVLGYTGTFAIGPSLFPNVGYDVRKDFAPIGRIATAPNTLVVHPSFNVCIRSRS